MSNIDNIQWCDDFESQKDNLYPLVQQVLRILDPDVKADRDIEWDKFYWWVRWHFESIGTPLKQQIELTWSVLAIIDIVWESINEVFSHKLDLASKLVLAYRETLLSESAKRLADEETDFDVDVVIDDYIVSKNWLRILEDEATDLLSEPEDEQSKYLQEEANRLLKRFEWVSEEDLKYHQFLEEMAQVWIHLSK